MASVTYIRVTPYGASAPTSGETGTWIPVSDLALQTQAAGTLDPSTGATSTDPAFSLSFALSNDDAIVNTLNDTVEKNAPPFQIEVATYDPSTATETSAGTLLSYTVSSKTYVASQTSSGGVAAGTGSTSTSNFTLALGNISQTTYPPGGQPSSSAYTLGQNAMNPPVSTTPTPVPGDVANGSSVAGSTSAAPAGSGLTYYARFVGVSGIDSNTFYAVDDVATGTTQSVAFGVDGRSEVSAPGFNDFSMRIENLQDVYYPLLTSGLTGNSSFGLQIEAIQGNGSSARVVDTTTYSQVLVGSEDAKGNYSFNYTGFLTQHLDAQGKVTSGFGSNLAASSAYAPAVPQSPVGAGVAFAADLVKVPGLANTAITGVDFSVGRGISTPNGNTAHRETSAPSVSELTFGSGSTSLALQLDNDAFFQKDGQAWAVFQGQSALVAKLPMSGPSQREYDLTNALVSGDQMDLISGERTYSVNFTKLATKVTRTSTDFNGADPSAPTTTTNTAFVEFRDASGNVIKSSDGTQWFQLDTANFFVGRTVGTDGSGNRTVAPPVLDALHFSILQNSVTPALDTAIANGQPLTVEVASYKTSNDASNRAIQSDYVFNSGVLAAHTDTTNPDSQAFTLTDTSSKTLVFQDTQYDPDGALIGSFNYYTGTNASGAAVATTASFQSPPPNGGATTLDVYAQFVGADGVPLTDARGSTWFKVPGTTSSVIQNISATNPLSLALSLGDTDVATQLHADQLAGTALGQVNVATYDSGTIQSYQRYTGVKVGTDPDDTIDNAGGDNRVTLSYTGYGERIQGAGLKPSTTASAGSNPSVPSAVEFATTRDPGTAAAPSLSQLSYVAEFKAAGSEVFAGSNFVATSQVSIDLSKKTATFEVDPAQAAALAQAMYTQPELGATMGGAQAARLERLEIAGYAPGSGRSLDYVLTGAQLTSTSVDPVTGLEIVNLNYTNYQETKTTSPLTSQTAMSGAAQVIDAPQDAEPPACFAAGTAIRTPTGDVPVEALAIGDHVVTAAGAHRLVRWLGRRSYAGRFANANPDVLPVCFKAGSLAENVPARDLWVSPKHAMFLDGMLIPAECLVNGISVVKATRVDRVNYYHIELDSHDVLLAEGAPSESFVDDGGRQVFHNAHEYGALYPDAATTEAIYCAPRIESGYALEITRRRILARTFSRADQRCRSASAA